MARGTALVTSDDAPSLDAVYEPVAVERDGELRPGMKLSTGNVTNPGRKSVRRVERDGRFQRDVLSLRSEQAPGDEQRAAIVESGSTGYPSRDSKAVATGETTSYNTRERRSVLSDPPRSTR